MSTSVNVFDHNGSVQVATWAALAGAESGLGAQFSGRPDRTVQVSGTFGSATVILEGSNDNVTWFALTKPGNTPISFTSAGGCAIVEAAVFIRPTSSGGTGSSIVVAVSAI